MGLPSGFAVKNQPKPSSNPKMHLEQTIVSPRFQRVLALASPAARVARRLSTRCFWRGECQSQSTSRLGSEQRHTLRFGSCYSSSIDLEVGVPYRSSSHHSNFP